MKFIWSLVSVVVVILTSIVLYEQYGDSVRRAYFGQGDEYTVYVNQVAFGVDVADTQSERKQGLSGVPALSAYQGKLFIFDASAKHGIWMQDMLFPIDILWFDDQFKLIHVESNVSPETYPTIFAPNKAARFVLELSAYSAETLRLTPGDTLTLPTALIPGDLKNTF